MNQLKLLVHKMSPYLLGFLLLFCFLTQLFSQSPHQLRQQLKGKKPDSTYVETMLQLGAFYQMRRNDSTKYVVYQADSLARAISYKAGEVRGKMALARYHHVSLNDYSQAAKLLKAAESLAFQYDLPVYLAELYNGLGLAFYRLGIQDSAFAYMKKAEKHYLDQGRDYDVWEVYDGLIKVSMALNEHEKMLDYALKSYEAVKDGNNRMDIGYTLYQAISVTMRVEEIQKHNELMEAWYHFKSAGQGKNRMGIMLNHAIVDLMLEDDTAMVARVEEAYRLANTQQDFLVAGLQAGNLGQYWEQKDQIDRAIYWLTQCAEAYRKGNLMYSYKMVTGDLYRLYKKQSQTGLALQALEEYSALEDSLQQIETLEQIKELEIRFDTERKEAALFERTQQRNLWLASAMVLGLLAIAILILLGNRLKINRKLAAQQAALQANEIRQLRQELQLKGYEAMISGQEAERSRIAKDLHDSVGGSLASVKAFVQAAEDKRDEKEKASLFAQTTRLIDQTTEEVRRISHNLLPRSLELAGLSEAVRDLCGDLERQGLSCELEIRGSEHESRLAAPVMVYRILQELLHNITKHAHAKQVLVQLLFTSKALEILVEDDGIGFDYKKARQSDGLGLNSMLSRVDVMQGTLDVDSVIGEGATVNMSIPLQGD